jgi:hypothetical protein
METIEVYLASNGLETWSVILTEKGIRVQFCVLPYVLRVPYNVKINVQNNT